MPWRTNYQMGQKFEVLKADPNAASRGLGLELFLAELFGREHFRVEPDFVAHGRQIDLFVVRGDLHLLVEAKWTKKRSQHEVIDEMRARLETAPPGVVGLVVSMSGFSANVIERVGRSAKRPILLMDGHEVEKVVALGGGIHSLVQTKLDRLRRERIAAVGLSSASTPVWLGELPEAGLKLVDLQGREHAWWESEGDFSHVVSSLITPDPIWAREGGIRLDMVLGVRDADDLIELLRKLAQLGWISAEGAWRIEQSGIVWSGLGPAEFGRQLTDWEPRYDGRRLHHSELAIYVDESDDGMLRISADLSANSARMVRWCELSFMLPGVPLDATPFQALTAELSVMNTPSFQLLGDDPVRRARLGGPDRPMRARPLAYLVRNGSLLEGVDESVRWVEGIVVADSFFGASDECVSEVSLPRVDLGHVFVQLRQHHHFGDDVTHDLLWTTLVQGAYASALHVMGDWEEGSP